MTTAILQEVEAIRKLFTALEPLQPKAREGVLDYVVRRLDIKTPDPSDGAGTKGKNPPPPPEEPKHLAKRELRKVYIKALKEQKKPQSAIEMATLLAYYLSHKAPPNQRKHTIATKDVQTYFKIAGFQLPTKPRFTLPNAKGAGYLDAVGNGEYKLNPVGYKLVVHSMPKTDKQVGARTSNQVQVRKKKTTKAKK